MNSFKLFRTICRSTCIFRNSYFNFIYCRLDDICKNWSGITYNRLIIIVIKNQCPFCGKSLRVVPINSEEYCPHCGCKIEQEHKKISVWRIEKIGIYWRSYRSIWCKTMTICSCYRGLRNCIPRCIVFYRLMGHALGERRRTWHFQKNYTNSERKELFHRSSLPSN